MADDLLQLEAMGYIDKCETLVEARTGRQYVNRIFVRGGLTDLGREALEKHL